MKYKNVILVDSSYTSFYRFFATRTWYSMAFKEEYKEITDFKTYNWLENKEFIEKYEKMYLDSIKKLVSTKVYNDSIIIFARDPPQETIWRNDETCDYKAGRQDLTEKHNFKPVFKLTYQKLIPKWTKDNDNMFEIKQEKIEADDIIALSCKYITEKFKDKNIYIVSGDEDFLQLGNDNVYFANYRKKKVFQLTKEEATNSLVKKIVEGDCSDNIPSIFKGKRIPNKKSLLEDIEKLMDFINDNSDYKKKYDKNKKIIDFEYIPEKFKKKFNKVAKTIFV